MRLRDLDATFLRLIDSSTHARVSELAGAHGLMFLCPKCFAENLKRHGDGRYGTHSVICWFVGVDPAINPKPGRWTPQGTGLDDLTFVPSPGRSQSVALMAGCMWHGFVTAGSAV